MAILLGLTRTYARSLRGRRVNDFKPFYRRAKITVVAAISSKQVMALMTIKLFNGRKGI